MSFVRVLVVDDYEPFRSFVCSTLRKRPEFQIVGQASDGLEALQQAEKLQPDLILLDIGLPTLNGIDAARRIRMVSAKSKIVFISQESSTDVVQEAFSSGATGYVVKTDVGIELPIAIKAVLRGERFVSSSLAGTDRNKVVAPFPTQNSAVCHEVAFYADDAALVEGFTHFLKAALDVGNAAILIATAEHRSDILQRLRANAVDVDGALKNGSLIQLDALDTASTLMVNGVLDPVHGSKVVGDVVTQAFKNANGAHARVAICGECAPTLLKEGNEEAAIRLEHLWDEIMRGHLVDTLCGYLWTLFPQRESSPMFARIRAEHSAIVGR